MKYKIKTILPEQKTIEIRKNGQPVRTVTVKEKLSSLQTVGLGNFKRMLAPNREDHDAKTNPIINYFADRQHTELILRKIEKEIEKNCFFCKTCENCQNLEKRRKIFKKMGFWSFNKNIKKLECF